MKNKKKLILIISMFIGVIVLALASSYALFTINVTKNTDFKIVLGNLELKITDTNTEDKYILENIVPTKDSVALTQDGYTFTVTNTGSIDSYYTVYLDDILLESEKERLDNSYLKIDIFNHKTNNHKTSKLTDYNNENRKIVSGQLKKGQSITYTLRMWVDYNTGNEAQDKYFAIQIRVVGEQLNAVAYQEKILNGADPVLTDNLVPIKIDDKGTVTKVNIKDKWYSYENKNWANAVVLKDRYDTNTIYDLSGNGNNATIYGATITDEGLYFDGIDDYAKIDLLDWKSTTEFTIEFEAKVLENNDDAILFESSKNSNNNQGSFYIDTQEYGNKDLTLAMKYPVEGGPNHKFADNILKDDFTTYTITFNSKNTYDNFTNIYVEGIKQNLATPHTASNIYANDISNKTLNNYSFTIGSRNGELLFTKMILKSLKIYIKELTQEEINNNLNNNTTTDKLILMYDLNNYSNIDVIPEEIIESYFVWIPKYSYQLWDLGNYSSLTAINTTKPHAIPIKFGLTNTSDTNTGECTTPGVAGESGNCKVGDYMTHPAFLAFDSQGFWVGKFETGYDGATTQEEAQIDVNEVDTSKIITKPNSYSWRNINVGNAFKNSYDYLRNDESHMMKNTEWGAVAYLSHSTYGINDDVRINNNRKFITGYSATEKPTIGYNEGISVEGNRIGNTILGVDSEYTVNYLNNKSVLSSTTGNYTGIYDMSGSAWEYVMGYTTASTTVGGSSNITTTYPDFFTNLNWEKYYDKYTSSSDLNFNNRILGDATSELGPFEIGNYPSGVTFGQSSWYNDFARYINSNSPWFFRGGDWIEGINTGIFAFSNYNGGVNTHISFRIVLTPTQN